MGLQVLVYSTSPESAGSDNSAHRVKKWAPKTRTGCLVCRERRVKCDERRPCRRCQKAGRQCRYGDNWRHNTSWQDNSGKACAANASSLTPAYGDSECLRYLEVFRSLTAPWLGAYFNDGLFARLLPQSSWHHPGLRHVLVAVAMASEQTNTSVTTTRPYRRMWHYNQALQHLYTDQDAHHDLILSASVLFWIHDNIMGDPRNAIVHFRGLMQLVIEKKLQMSEDHVPELMQAITRGLIYWSHSADLRLQEVDPSVIGTILNRLSLSDDEYSVILSTPMVIRNEARIYATSFQWTVDPDDLGQTPVQRNNITVDELAAFARKLHRCALRGPVLFKQTDKVVFECHYKLFLVILKIHKAYIKYGSLCIVLDPADVAELAGILDELEELNVEDVSQQPGREDLVIPLTAIIPEIGRSAPVLRARAADLLRTMKRIEGFWHTNFAGLLMASISPPEANCEDRLTAEKVQHVADAVSGFSTRSHNRYAGEASWFVPEISPLATSSFLQPIVGKG